MNRKLWLINLVLLGLAAYMGLQLRERWRAEKVREAAELHHTAPAIPAPPFTAAPVPPAATPVTYVDIAQKDLFDRSRNPDVPVEVAPPPPKPPMPALPVYFGSMNFGDGPMAILSPAPGGPQQEIHPGQMIGPFKLIDITRKDLTFEWNGEMVRKSIDELRGHGAPAPVETANTGRSDAPAAPAAPVRVEAQTAKGPGGDTVDGRSKLCQTNDSTPFGTVQDGLRKTEIKTPFGTTCLWDPVSK